MIKHTCEEHWRPRSLCYWQRAREEFDAANSRVGGFIDCMIALSYLMRYAGSLGNNKIGDVGADAIAAGLTANKTLTEL